MLRKTGRQKRDALAWTRIELVHLAGKTVAEIAADEGLSPDWVRAKLRALAAEPPRQRQRRLQAVRLREAARIDALILGGDYVKAAQLARALCAHRTLLAREDVVTGQEVDRTAREGAGDDTEAEPDPDDVARRRAELCRKLVLAAETRGEIERGTWDKIERAGGGGSEL